jgi:hypothetical protein
VSIAIALCAASCGSNASPVAERVSTTTDPRVADQDATFLGLSVRLTAEAPTVENDRTFVRVYFIVRNDTKKTISYSGCPFGQFAFGLLPAAHPDGPLTGTSTTSCSPGVVSKLPGKAERSLAVALTTRSSKVRIPPGDYVVVIRFRDGTELRKSMTLST